MNLLRHLATVSTAVAAMLLAVLPLIVALDYGGVMWWTQYLAALVIMVAFGLTLPTLLTWSTYFRPRQLVVLIPMLMWTFFSAFQTTSLSPGLVKSLSPASYSAYTEWLAPILPADALPATFPISIDVDQSIHALALLGMVLVLTWTSMQVFNTRARLIGLLSMVAIVGGVIAALGIVAQVFPNLAFFETIAETRGNGFSTFINRNNAALTMNIGLAASFGLLAWRLSALTGQEIDGDEFELIDLFALTSDRDSMIGLGCGVLCLVGLLVCGSRSGIGAVFLGTLLSLGWLRTRKGFATIPVVLVAGAIVVALLAVPLQLNLESIKRLELFSDNSTTILNDGRFVHWPEGLQAGVQHLPAGSGLSTYGYAHLPFQNEASKSWFVHADNLWLELFVEQGLFGILAALCLLIAMIWCLSKMADSHDALDHGLRIVGWYCVAAILFTQTLDFGLIIPANYLLIVPLFAGIVTRSVESDLLIPDEDETPSLVVKFWNHPRVHQSQTVIGVVTVLCVGLIGYSSIRTLDQDAKSESAARFVQARLDAGSATMEVLTNLRNQLSPMDSLDERITQHIVIADVERRIARLEDTIALKPSTQEDLENINEATRPNFRRLVATNYEDVLKEFPSKLASLKGMQPHPGYLNAAKIYEAILRRRPLDRDARQGLIITDFISSDSERTKQLILQLSQLYLASPDQSRDLARIASQSGFNELATELWTRAIELNPTRTAFLMNLVDDYKNIKLTEVLPKLPRVYRIVATTILINRNESMYAMLPELVDGLGCDDCSSIEEKSECLSLAAKARQATGDTDEAITLAVQAAETNPASSTLRLQLIELLRKDGQRAEALKHARIGRSNAPKDARFDAVIAKMAEFDIRAANQ